MSSKNISRTGIIKLVIYSWKLPVRVTVDLIGHLSQIAKYYTKVSSDWSFVKKDLYLVIIQKLIFLEKVKSAGFQWSLQSEIYKGFSKIWQISNKIRWISHEIHLKTLKSVSSWTILHFHGVQWEGYVWGFHKKSTRFHEIWQISYERKTTCQEW